MVVAAEAEELTEQDFAPQKKKPRSDDDKRKKMGPGGFMKALMKPGGLLQVVADNLGVVKKVILEGQGWETPREPYEVKVWISGKICEGKLVSSCECTEPYFFTFGKSELPLVGDFEEIHFEVDLVHFVQVRDMLGDGRLIKRRIHDGQGDFTMDCPLHDSRLQVHYKGMLLDTVYSTILELMTMASHWNSVPVPEGFEMCVRLMLPGEIALVTCPPDFAYDKFPRPPDVLEGAHIQWQIELLGFCILIVYTCFTVKRRIGRV